MNDEKVVLHHTVESWLRFVTLQTFAYGYGIPTHAEREWASTFLSLPPAGLERRAAA